jgi:hypothetical protein
MDTLHLPVERLTTTEAAGELAYEGDPERTGGRMAEVAEVPVVRAARKLLELHRDAVEAMRSGNANAATRSQSLAASFEWQAAVTALAGELGDYMRRQSYDALIATLQGLVSDDTAYEVFDSEHGGLPFCPYCLSSGDANLAIRHATDCPILRGRDVLIAAGVHGAK